jgi:tetratricopeptide (TPR) repeat protein
LAIKVNPKGLSFAYRYLAAVQADNENYTGAIAILSDGIRVNPQDIDMILNRAGYYTCQGIYANAIKDYDACIKYRPDSQEAWKYRGNLNFAVGALEDAITDYTRSLDFEPADYGSLNNMAIAQLGLGDYENSLQNLEKATAVPDSPALLLDNVRLATYVKEKVKNN